MLPFVNNNDAFNRLAYDIAANESVRLLEFTSIKVSHPLANTFLLIFVAVSILLLPDTLSFSLYEEDELLSNDELPAFDTVLSDDSSPDVDPPVLGFLSFPDSESSPSFPSVDFASTVSTGSIVSVKLSGYVTFTSPLSPTSTCIPSGNLFTTSTAFFTAYFSDSVNAFTSSTFVFSVFLFLSFLHLISYH